ncbi:MAG: hypothetical protein LAO31_19145 [Acidobacteriia bacterium]|nr:hypothetical protein [Terriglobia bacterium]
MSETQMNLKDWFALPGDDLPPAARTAVESSRFMPALREALLKESRAIKWGAVSDVLVKKILETLDVPLLDILLPAWKKYREIEEFADPKKYPPADTYLVSLAEHTVKSEHHPYVEVLFKGATLGRIDFTLTVELTLEGFVLQIQGGRIKAIRTGTIKGQGSLALETTVVLEKDFGSIELPGMLQLGEGIPLQ